jgi:dihydroflavonol-4-reductase
MIHIGWQRVEQSRKINVDGTKNLIAACKASDARLVHVSTVDTLPAAQSIEQPVSETTSDGVPKVDSAYVISKREAETCVEHAIASGDIQGCITHPGFMLGPYDWKPSSGRMFREVTSAPLLAAPPGGGSVCDVRDVAAATIAAVRKCGNAEHFILAGHNIPYVELWKQMLQIAGKGKRPIIPLKERIRLGGRVIDAVNRFLSLPERDVNGATIAMGCLNHYYDSSRAVEQLGYSIRPLDETLGDAWDWLKEL